jgi:hypothetical protein
MRRLVLCCTLAAISHFAHAQPDAGAPASSVAEAAPAPATPPASASAPVSVPPPPPIQHVPLHEAFTAAAELRFIVREPDAAGAIVVRCIPRSGARREHTVRAQRGAELYFARLPSACAQPPGFDYWVVRETAQGTVPVFASEAAPHAVRVAHTPERERELDRLRAHGYQRSRALLAFEGVDFGDRRLAAGTPEVRDRYYRIEAGYAYSFFGTIEDIALTLVRVRGENSVLTGADGVAALDPGIDYGRAAVTLTASEFVRLRSALLLGASQEGFEYGLSGEMVFGDPLAEHLLVGAEALTTLGTTGYLRLGFNATSAVPMGARVELTDFPLGEDAAVRLLYEVGYRFTPATELMLRGGYQGRTSVVGGPSLGAALRYGF